MDSAIQTRSTCVLNRRLLVVMLLAGLVAASCSGGRDEPEVPTAPLGAEETPTPALEPTIPTDVAGVTEAFAQAWERGEWDLMASLVGFGQGAEAVALHRAVTEELQVDATQVVVSPPVIGGGTAEAALEVGLDLDGLGVWTYPTTLSLIQLNDPTPRWVVDWQPATIHPALRQGQRLARRLVWPQRGMLLGADGSPLRTDVDIVDIGIEPQRIEDREQLLSALEAILDADPAQVADALDAPGVQPDWFVPVTTLREAAYEEVEELIQPLPGVVVRFGTDRRGPVDSFAAQVLGATGPITAEQLDELGEPYTAATIVGRSGLELVHERALAGTPSGDIRILDAAGTMVSVLQRFPGQAAVDVRTTLDRAAQLAAEQALDGVAQPAALVAIDASTGEIRAIVSRPAEDFGRALTGTYPPGSTFKTVTAAAFLAEGGAATSTISCPARVVVTGRPFENAFGGLGSVSLQTAYARSCNTAFVNVSQSLSDGALDAMASVFGFDTDYSVGLLAAGGSIPDPVDQADLAASAIGQGRVTASPVHMASVAAAVADGSWRQPQLVLDPASDLRLEPRPLPSGIVDDLRAMMRATVTSGTGTAFQRVGGDASGKTGSAEFGDEDPPQTHAWFIGYRSGLAVAVLVEGGGAGGTVAAPLAAEFFAALDGAVD